MHEVTRILLADTDRKFVRLLSEALRKEGCKVCEAFTAKQALKSAREQHPDLLLLEGVLPDRSGHEVCREIKADQVLQETFVVLFKGKSLKLTIGTESAASGADYHIFKPKEPDELLALIHLIVRFRQAATALRASEERFRQVTENIREVFWMTDPTKQEMLYVSPGYAEIWGRSCQSLYAAPMSWMDAIHPSDRKWVREAALARQLSGTYDEQYRITRPDGSIRWIHDRAFPIRDGTGKVSRLVGIAEDITQRKQAEAELLILSQAVQSTSEPICITDLQDRFTFVNRAFQQSYGYSEAEILGRTPDLIASPNNPAGLLAEILQRTRQGDWRGEVLDRRKDGTEFPILLSTSQIKDPHGTVVGLMGVAQDITDRKLAEQKIRLLADALQSAQEFISITDSNNRFIFVNNALLTAYGYEEEEILEKSPDLLVSVREPAGINEDILKKTLAGGWSGELLNRRKDGSEFPIWLSTAQIKGRDGTVLGLLGIARDISVQKRAERQKRAFSELGYRLSAAATPHQAANIILEIAANLFDWDAAYLHLYSAAEDLIIPILTIDTIGDQRMPVPETSFTLTPSPLMRAVMEDGARLLNTGDEPLLTAILVPFGDKARPSASKMYVPVHSGGKVLGILSVQSYSPQRYSLEDLSLLQALADHCGEALERIKVAEALRKAEANYRTIFENVTEGVFQSTPDGRYLSANPALARMFGYESPEELMSELMNIEQTYVLPQRRNELKRLLETQGSAHGFEAERYRKDGSKFWLSVSARCVRDASGSVLYYEGTNRDVTERKRNQAQLSDALELNTTILATASIGIRAYRASGQCIFANGAAGQIFGASPDELLAQNFRELSSWKQSGLLALAEECLRTRKAQAGEVHLVAEFGKDLWVDCRMAAFVSGAELHLLCLQSDITQRKQSEEELRQLPLRIIEAQEAERKRVAQELHDSVNQLIASAAMRLRRVDESIGKLRPSAREILHRSQALLVQAQEENRRIAHDLRPRDLDELGFAVACRNFCTQFRDRTGMAVKCSIARLRQRLPPWQELNLFRIIQEALNNIEKHAGATLVTLRITVGKKSLLLRIQDDGLGSAARGAERAKSARHGIGLTNMRERTAALGGTFQVTSRPKQGTTITVQVPL